MGSVPRQKHKRSSLTLTVLVVFREFEYQLEQADDLGPLPEERLDGCVGSLAPQGVVREVDHLPHA